MRYSICAEMIHTEVPFHERLELIRQAGFEAFEFWAWKDKQLPRLEQAVEGGMQVATFSGQRAGSLVEPQDLEGYEAEVRESMATAKRLGCDRLMVLSDELSDDGRVRTKYRLMSQHEKKRNITEGLKRLAPQAEQAEVTLLLEPLNTLVDHVGYTLESTRDGLEIIDAVGSPRVRLLYDVYHMQIMEGNVIATLEEGMDRIGHIHVADVPGRHEPGTGELNYRNILGRVAELGYQGFVGFELSPAGDSEAALAAIRELCSSIEAQRRKR